MKIADRLHRLGVPVVRTVLPGFDKLYYQYWYRDVMRFPGGPLLHYIRFGWREGRDPSAGFSTSGYLAANPDVAALEVCPLVHFLESGFAEGRTGWRKDPKAPPPLPKLVDEPVRLLTGPRPEQT